MEIEDIKIITSSDQARIWDETIEGALYERILSEASMEHTFEKLSAYAVLNYTPVLIGGIIVKVHLNTLWIDAIWVAHIFRKKGIGSRLLNQATKFAIESNCTSIQLNTYFKDSFRFFEHNGFQEVACIPNWKYNLDCYFLSKICIDPL